MKVLIVRPPRIMGGLEKSSVQHPINIASLAAYLLQVGIETRIIDFEVEHLSDEDFAERLIDYSRPSWPQTASPKS